MASYTYSIQCQDLIYAAFRTIGVFNDDDPVPTTDYANALQALNLMIKQYMSEGKPLWCIEDISIPFEEGLGSIYNPIILGTGLYGVLWKPLKCDYARLLDNTSNNEIPLQELSRQEYNMLGTKTDTGTPNSYMWDPQTTYVNVSIYVTPDTYNATNVDLIMTVQRPLADMVNPTDTFDFPIECLNTIKWGLASELCIEYDVPKEKAELIAARAEKYKANMFDFSQEEASIFFTPAAYRR